MAVWTMMLLAFLSNGGVAQRPLLSERGVPQRLLRDGGGKMASAGSSPSKMASVAISESTWCTSSSDFPIMVPITDSSACAALKVKFGNVTMTTSGACFFTGTALQAMSSCADESTCAGIVGLNTVTAGRQYLAFQKPRGSQVHLLTHRQGGNKFCCDHNRRLKGGSASVSAGCCHRRLKGGSSPTSSTGCCHRRLKSRPVPAGVSASTPTTGCNRRLESLDSSMVTVSVAAPAEQVAPGWCTVYDDHVTMLAASADSSCVVHAAAFCKWVGLANAKANCERTSACSGIVDNGNDTWLAYSSVQTFPVFYLDSSSPKTLAGTYGDCKGRRLEGTTPPPQVHVTLVAVAARGPDMDKIPLLLDSNSKLGTTGMGNTTASSTNSTSMTTGVVSSSATASSTRLFLVPLAALLLSVKN